MSVDNETSLEQYSAARLLYWMAWLQPPSVPCWQNLHKKGEDF